MSGQTLNYQLGYFLAGEFSDATTESRRWNTLDNLLWGIYNMLGNGVLSGWAVTAGAGLSVNIAAGTGVISFVPVKSTQSTLFAGLLPNAVNYLYASLTASSYFDQSVTFVAFPSSGTRNNLVYLAAITTNLSGVTDINTDLQVSVGLFATAQDAVKLHHHTGAPGEPTPINLANEVEGVLPQENLGDLDASLVSAGQFNAAQIPQINHQTGLTNRGTLTHAQLDSFVETLNNPAGNLMGETVLVNFLQLVLSLKQQSGWQNIDNTLVNELAYIPGISPDSVVDAVNTTAVVDTVDHVITATPGSAMSTLFQAYASTSDFETATLTNLVVDTDVVLLNPTTNQSVIDDFTNVSDWAIQIIDLSSQASGTFSTDSSVVLQGSATSGLLQYNVGTNSNLAMVVQKNFAAQDWSSFNRLVFYINTSNVDHGDLLFYLNDANAGDQNSYTMVLPRGTPSINQDTLMVGWREITIDISSYTRTAITSVGFFTSSQVGWDASQPLWFNLDNMYLSSGNQFVPTGTAIFQFGNNAGPSYNFTTLRWDILLPASTTFQARYRVANNVSSFTGMDQVAWSAYNSGTFSGGQYSWSIGDTSTPMYNLIQVEVSLAADPTLLFSPELHRLFIDYQILTTDNAFTYATQNQWLTGTLTNIDAATDPNSILVAGTAGVGGITFGSVGAVVQTNSALTPLLTIAGTGLSSSILQTLGINPPGFGQISSVSYGPDGSMWLADTDNDRVVQISASGDLMLGFYGVCVTPPTPTVSGTGSGTPTLLQAIYNNNLGVLNLMFSAPINPQTITPGAFYLILGAHRFYFSSASIFTLWGQQSTASTFQSNVLQITLSQVDNAALNSIADFYIPSLSVITPTEQQHIIGSNITIQFQVSNATLRSSGTQIRITRNDAYEYYSTNTVSYVGLSNGLHVLTVVLVDNNLNPFENPEAQTTFRFVIDSTDSIHEPYVSITTPLHNQRYSTGTVIVDFSVAVFALDSQSQDTSELGNHLQYILDANPGVDYYTDDPITLTGLVPGKHTITILLVDENDNPVIGDYVSATIDFVVGINSLAGLAVNVNAGGVAGMNGVACPAVVHAVQIGNVIMANLYAPIEVQFIPNEISVANPIGIPTVLIAKLGTLSTDQVVVNNYYDGHTVVQLDCLGHLIFSNNLATFTPDKPTAKLLLGSAEKISPTELLLGDTTNNRAIITATNLTTQQSQIVWEYTADRAVSDFRMVNVSSSIISINNDSIVPATLTVQYGTTVIWVNNSNAPVTIYSGTTTPAQFAADPDVTLYGNAFASQQLAPGEQYAFLFNTVGQFDWFAYPTILTGTILVSEAMVSSANQYLIVENDTASLVGGRIVQVDAWGNQVWCFGDQFLCLPRDVRPQADGSVIISV